MTCKSMAICYLMLACSALVHAHTVFTTLYVDSVNQGDGVSVRMNMDPSHTVDFIKDITSDDMACGVDGQTAVNRISPAKAGSTLTFEYRVWADGSHPEVPAIDISHKGPCSVYLKKVDDPLANGTAAGDGWFKIYDESYDESTQEWCTIKMSNNNGHLSAVIPEDIAPGYYLARPELLALHQANQDPPIPQFYVGCAQIFVQSNGTASPPTVTIPENYVNLSMPAMSFNLYATPMALPYPMYGPSVYNSTGATATSRSSFESSYKEGQGHMAQKEETADACFMPSTSTSPTPDPPSTSTSSTSQTEPQIQTLGLPLPSCIAQNGNWCGVELSTYATETGCWNASAACWNQSTACYASQQPTGYTGCKTWEAKCRGIDDGCNAGDYNGPPDMGKMLTSISPETLDGGDAIVKNKRSIAAAAAAAGSSMKWASRRTD